MTGGPELSRRGALGAIVGIGAGVATGALAGCSGAGGAGRNDAPLNGAAVSEILPNQVPHPGIKPDLPGNDSGLQPAFLTYPDPAPAVTDGPAGPGVTLTAVTPVGIAAPPAVGDNAFWQHLHERLGGTLNVQFTPSSEYPNKFAAMLAGGELPEMAVVLSQPRMPEMLEATFADLTEHLAAANVEKYPSLANIPTYSWRSTIFNGKIFGVPSHRLLSGQATIVRNDLCRDAGLDSEPKSGEEFLALCRELSDPKRKRWAWGSAPDALVHVQEMLGAPNRWRETDGKFLRDIEAPETEQALDVVRGMWAEGLFHPNSYIRPDTRQWFMDGSTPIVRWVSSWSSIAGDGRRISPGLEVAPLPLVKFDGNGSARKFLGSGCAYFTAIRQAPEARIEELLRVLDWIASPYGSAEYLDVVFGVRGKHYTMEQGTPVWTELGQSQFTPVNTLATGPIIHQPFGSKDVARTEYAYEESVVADGEPLGTLGLYSSKDQSKGASLETEIEGLRDDIIQGRRPVSAWKSGVDRWRQRGGDEIRAEYEEAFAENA